MTMRAEHRSKFAALHRQCWRLHMSEKFSSGTKKPNQRNKNNTWKYFFYRLGNYIKILLWWRIFFNGLMSVIDHSWTYHREVQSHNGGKDNSILIKHRYYIKYGHSRAQEPLHLRNNTIIIKWELCTQFSLYIWPNPSTKPLLTGFC